MSINAYACAGDKIRFKGGEGEESGVHDQEIKKDENISYFFNESKNSYQLEAWLMLYSFVPSFCTINSLSKGLEASDFYEKLS